MSSAFRRGSISLVTVLATVLVVTSSLSGVAAAQSGAGGAIVVEEGETVSSVEGIGGAIVIHGTVTGDVSGAAGNVLITGTVDGDVSVAAGNLRISGEVGGDVSAGAGSVHLEEGSVVGGSFDAGAGDVRIDGSIGGDARIGAETIQIGENASIAGSLTYDGRLEGNRGAVAGDITRDRTLGPTALDDLQPLASWLASIYAFAANLLLGIVLLALFPRFSDAVADRVRTDSVRTGLVGLGLLLAIPLLLVALLITIIGIPIALAGLFAFGFLAWVSVVYGRFALGVWLLSAAGYGQIDRANGRWIGLVLGLLLGALFSAIPILGGMLNFVLFALGLGALAIGLYTRRGRRRGPESPLVPSNGG
ncbi:MAG: bactofilin family protein [Halobacteriota archaeon]|uniref:bactofilin family protein n=1 Tax=Natronomonas sp. TaxID=2184060 RepID=UPI003974E466